MTRTEHVLDAARTRRLRMGHELKASDTHAYRIRCNDGWTETRAANLLDAAWKAHMAAVERGADLEYVELISQ